eukprot:CAMPEP_0206194258 /NCGR_PEP_ID=MMETSP0166-20121206/7084_1 /ASSEMBLY_ACC=CAM_ASM_000260 /TAXON_ID=95228 /ORGANISM="Vannella robusta, Strain DIVA3 518/3/11/1/6" /LENGTH=389 /DNA_ID=CAMNT_0053611185 /DNA_START=20 /DNA_END=1185 /DNA_ORIENTATION=-
MDNDEAVRRCREGGTFLALDVPPGSEFGIDQNMWICAVNFKGIKMIPPGFHYIRWRNSQNKPSSVISGQNADRVSVVGENNSFLPLMGCFAFIKPSQIFVLRWDASIEDLVPLTEEESERYQQGVRRMEFDPFLAAFPFGDTFTAWKELTKHISDNTLDRNAPRSNKERQVQYLEDQALVQARLVQEWETFISNHANKEEGTPIENTQTAYMQDFRYESIPQRWIPHNESSCQGSDRTKYFMDKSYLLDHLINSKYGTWEELIGEFQFSFICFWLGESYESFEHWKQLMILFCNCDISISEHPEWWKEILQTIEKQMLIVPQDFFVDILSSKNFLEPSLKNLFSILDNYASELPLSSSYESLKSTIEQRFQRKFTPPSPFEFDSDDEDA